MTAVIVSACTVVSRLRKAKCLQAVGTICLNPYVMHVLMDVGCCCLCVMYA